MQRAAAISGPVRSLRRVGSTARLYLLTAVASIVLAALVVAGSGAFLRLLFAAVIGLLLISLALARSFAGVVATFVYLVVMALLRRMLIPFAAWRSTDPLLLVGPAVAIILLVKLFVLERQPLAPDLISKLVLAVLGLTVLEVANPTGAGIGANLVGLLFMAAPLLWFFVGREVLTDRLSDRLLSLLIAIGVIVAGYGVYQTQVGHPRWDVNWLNATGGYGALNVGGQVRAFGTFSSSAEYALFVGAALAVAVAFALRGRLLPLVAIPILGVSLFLSSVRGALVGASVAVVAMLGLRTRRPVAALIVALCAVGLAFSAVKVFGSSLSSSADASRSPLVSHQVGGIADPLNPSSSTLLLHVTLVRDGVVFGVTHPFGKGTGYTNNAAGVNPKSTLQQSQSTEVDISNAFVALGVVGGVLYLVLTIVVLRTAVVSFFAGRDAMLPLIGVLITALGQWLNGGDYALSSFSWIIIGVIAGGQPTRPVSRAPTAAPSIRQTQGPEIAEV